MLKEDGLTDKEITKINIDKRKNKDLNTLKGQGGPFTDPGSVESNIKQERY